jgi:PEP-CTERM motif
MNNAKKFLLASSIFILSSAAQAQVVFSDNFDANSLGLNAVPAGWTVTAGTVDIIGDPDYFNFIPGSGRFIDLDGSTGDAGILSKSLLLSGGTQYTASFQLAGNHRDGNTETVTGILGVGIGNTSSIFSLPQNAGWTNYSLVFTPTTTGAYVLSFGNSGGDNIGMLLDNVSVSVTSDVGVTSAVPEPETYAMLLAGLGLLGFAARRRKVKEAAA